MCPGGARYAKRFMIIKRLKDHRRCPETPENQPSAVGLSRPDLDLSVHSRRATTRVTPTGPVPSPPMGFSAFPRGGRACRVPPWIFRRIQDGRPQGSPLRGPCRIRRWVSTHSLVGDGLVASRLGFVGAFKAGDHKGRPYGARAESTGGFQRIPLWGTGLSRPALDLSVRSRRATTRVAPTGPVPSPPMGFSAFPRRGRACPVPPWIFRRIQDGRPQGSPLRGRCRVRRWVSAHFPTVPRPATAKAQKKIPCTSAVRRPRRGEASSAQ